MCTRNDLEKILKKIVIIYRNIYDQNLCDIYLYGSYARGDYNTESDIDIVAIVKGERRELQNQLKQIWDIVYSLLKKNFTPLRYCLMPENIKIQSEDHTMPCFQLSELSLHWIK